MVPGFLITARAKTTYAQTNHYITQTITGPLTTRTTTILLGNTPIPQPVPAADPPPLSNEKVIGAAIGSIFGFILLLALIVCCIRRSRAEWVPYFGSQYSSRSSFSVYVQNPNTPFPTLASRRGPPPATRVRIEEDTIMFTRYSGDQHRRPGPPR